MHAVVVAELLTAQAFARFGQVISAGDQEGRAANQGTAVRFDWAAKLVNTRSEAKPNLAVFRSTPRPLPIELKLLEQHPCSTQLFAPMIASRYLVCVAPTLADGLPDVAQLRAFICNPGQGVNYAPGTWHCPIIALDAPADFLMLAWEDGTARDCVEHPLDAPVRIELAAASH